MTTAHRISILAAISLAILLCLNCGGNSAPTRTASAPTPPTATPPPTTTPTTTTPTPQPAVPASTFDSPLEAASFGVIGSFGHLVINANANDGTGSVTLTGVPDTNMKYSVNFCPFEGGCVIRVATFNVDANGNGSTTLKFPQTGTFAGVFRVLSDDDRLTLYTAAFSSGARPSTQTLHLVRSSDVTPHPESWAPMGTDPLLWGVINVDEGTNAGRLELHGAVPNKTYGLVQCDANKDHLPVCTSILGSFTTDGTGSANLTFAPATDVPVNIYEIKAGDLHEFVTGFTVP